MIKKVAQAAVVSIILSWATSAQTRTDTSCTRSGDTINCTSTDNAVAVEQERKAGEQIGNALGVGLAKSVWAIHRRVKNSREAHREVAQQEKSDLARVDFCYQHPQFSNSCEQLLAHTSSDCLANPKSPLCKDVAKLGPPLVARRVDALPIPKAQTAAQPITQAATAQPREIIAPQSQTADTSTPRPEVSVAEAARQARIAKAVREAKEKAERDNPPPPQQ